MFEMPSGYILAGDEFFRNQMGSLTDAKGSEELHRSRPTVLVVDDERRIADTLKEILEMNGFHVVAAYDGWDALETVAHFQPDYVLSDVLMPRMNGVELAISLRKMFPTTRILLFSGQAGISEILMDGYRQGFEFELIAKPIHPLKLIEHLKNQQS
ncbi:response regulator [Acidicapsa ligni]|uniref:response regulator n=1 Tax=Acidicapsa ligni TaxID=542300 RepID=UPI0021E0ACD5|nr:response regulator [Acidicapsa ligni]